MKKRLLKLGLTRLRKLGMSMMFFGLLSSFSALAQDVLPFRIVMTDYLTTEHAWIKVKIYNDSRHDISQITGTIGNINENFNTTGNFAQIITAESSPIGTWAFKSAKESDKFEINGTGFGPGEHLTFHVDISGSHQDYRRVLFNNGGTVPNAIFTVSGGGGDASESITLPDGPSDEAIYTFYSESRPRKLEVDSLTEVTDLSPLYVNKARIKVNNVTVTNNVGSLTTLSVYAGDVIEVSAAESVYKDAAGSFLTDLDIIRRDATERFVSTGITVNNVPQTGDPNLYRFTMGDSDSRISVKWRHDYALRVEHDFSNTESSEKVSGDEPWAGPLISEAVGNPIPEVKLHWIPKGETVIGQIDGQVIDYTHPGLGIRYVPSAYIATGAASDSGNSTTNEIVVGQSPPARQQVKEFAMDQAGEITYVWKIQYGITVNADSTEHSILPIIRKHDGTNYVTVISGEGTFWFDPATDLQVLCAKNEDSSATSLALSGWLNGDGFYMGAQGQINSADGSLIGDSSVGRGKWINSAVADNGFGATNSYHGIQISGNGLQRPVRLMWTYGNQAIAVTVPIGEYVLQDSLVNSGFTYNGATFLTAPKAIRQIAVMGSNKNVAEADMAVWDDVAAKLYPLVPGMFRVTWPSPDNPGTDMDVLVTAIYPETEHYPHIAKSPPVNVDPDPLDKFIFNAVKYTENETVVDSENLFATDNPGHTVLLFSEIDDSGRGDPKEYLRVRVVRSRRWDDTEVLRPNNSAIIGQRIEDPLDLAQLKTGYLIFPNARYNPFVYDANKLDGLSASQVYDMDALRSTAQSKDILFPENLPGPIIPVNLHPGAVREQKIVVAWYDDPTLNDGLLWPYAARAYDPKWPVNESEGLGRIVIASQFGSESVSSDLQDQTVVGAITNLVADGLGGFTQNIVPAESTYNPTRIQQPIIYNQPDDTLAGYNPNEEHALMVPSLRYAQVSPRPPAAYALRNNDLNRYTKAFPGEEGQPTDYTSHPYVLTQFYDVAAEEFKMRVYTVQSTASEVSGYTFANANKWNGTSTPSSASLNVEPHVTMVAGEPVIPFYPLGVVIGAVPPPESFGKNITSQLTYWEDHKNTSWSVSGGENAWFSVSPFYPLQPDFWWEAGKIGRIRTLNNGSKVSAVPNVGDSLSFLPGDLDAFATLNSGSPVLATMEEAITPTEILYSSDWPDVAPILKAGETLTFAGGEYRADHPTSLTIDEDGNTKTVETPGLPEVLAFAAAEVVYDSLNPSNHSETWVTNWSARVAQVLEKRAVELNAVDFPVALSPASGRTRISQGKYVFNELPASLQKRVRYDATNGKLEVFGLVNDKDIGEDTLTAPPPAVYVLEPNILTVTDLEALNNLDESAAWRAAVARLQYLTQNPSGIDGAAGTYLVGLEQEIVRNAVSGEPEYVDVNAVPKVIKRTANKAAPLRAMGPGLALLPNADFLDPLADVPEVSWVTLVENNDPSLGGSPVTPHIIKIDRRERYRGAIKTVLSDNVFDENVVLRHQGDFGANADNLVFEWWYRPDDGSLNVPPPDLIADGQTNPWKLFPDLTGKQGRARYEALLKGNPNAPEALLADTWWYCRYRHVNDSVDGVDWGEGESRVNYTWAGAGNSDPFNDFDLNGLPDFKAQLAMGWIKRVLDAVNPYEARIRDFEGDAPSTKSSMIAQFGPRFEGPVALNPDKNVIENVGLIALYETILKRGSDLSINLSRPISTPAIANALQLASTRISDFYMLLANEAYADAQNPTIGFGSSSVDYGQQPPSVFAFQNQLSSLMNEELGLLRGLDDNFARPVYNRMFWNFTKGEGEAAYAMNYDISDINADGFIDEDDAMILYPMGHGDAWGHYLTAVRAQYDLLNHRYFNWVSRSEFYNLMDIVIKVDFLDERKFAQMAAAKAKAGAEVVNLSYREKYVEDPEAQWQGYTDSNPDRAWGVQGWSRRAAQGAYFDWVTANALLPSEHPNETLEGIQKVDRKANADIAVISANLNAVQNTFDQANMGYNPLGISRDTIVFDIDPTFNEANSGEQGVPHFEQLYERAIGALENAKTTWDYANEAGNRVRQVADTESEFRNDVFQEDLSYRNRLIEIFGRPYEGMIGSGKLYAPGYDGPDLALYMYVDVREINDSTVPGPSAEFAEFKDGKLSGGDLHTAFNHDGHGKQAISLSSDWRTLFSPTLAPDSIEAIENKASDSMFAVNYTDLESPKVELENFTDLMPVTTAGYTYQAPEAWGNRLAAGELQSLLNEMLQQEAAIAEAISAWNDLTGSLILTLRMVDARIIVGDNISEKNDLFTRVKLGIEQSIVGIEALIDVVNVGEDVAKETLEAVKEMLPKNLPTGGLAVSPGDALAPGRGAVLMGKIGAVLGSSVAEGVAISLKAAAEIGLSIAETELEIWTDNEEGNLEKREWLKEIEDAVGDEAVMRIAIFKEIEALRNLSDRYRALLDEGARLVDERAAFNKRVAAATQLNRYQDMTFRVSRNHALRNYRSSYDLAARYAYLAAKAYDYETSFDPSYAGAPQSAMKDIVKARGLGLVVDGQAQFGGGGLAEPMAWLKTNYDSIKGQLGINNPQNEVGKISLRTERYRIYPKGTSPAADSAWKQQLHSMWVDNLWEVSEFREYCRPFGASPADGVEPGLVIRFSADIAAGKNLFGRDLSGGDHAYDPSVFATKIRAVGVWFSDYQSTDLEFDLPAAPRVYLMPTGTDVQSVSTSADPNQVRYWNVKDQRIPVPIPALESELDLTDWMPITDSLNGHYGEHRRFSSFRAYHDGSYDVNDDELVYNSRLVGRSVRNTQWVLIIPGRTLNADPEVGLQRFIDQISDIKLVFKTYGNSGN